MASYYQMLVWREREKRSVFNFNKPDAMLPPGGLSVLPIHSVSFQWVFKAKVWFENKSLWRLALKGGTGRLKWTGPLNDGPKVSKRIFSAPVQMLDPHPKSDNQVMSWTERVESSPVSAFMALRRGKIIQSEFARVQWDFLCAYCPFQKQSFICSAAYSFYMDWENFLVPPGLVKCVMYV